MLLESTHPLTLVTTSLLGWLIAVVIYRIAFHPLAGYPGPQLAKISGWYGFKEKVTGVSHIHLVQLHTKYGDIVRTGPNSLSFNNVQALHDIYGDRHANVKKTGFTESQAATLKSRTLQTTQDLDAHAQRKKLVNHGFSDESLRSVEEHIEARVQNWCDHLPQSKEWSKPMNMKDWISYLIMDMMAELCFGYTFGAVEKNYSLFPETIQRLTKEWTIMGSFPFEDFCRKIIVAGLDISKYLGLLVVRAHLNFDKEVGAMIGSRLALEEKGEERRDFFHYLKQATDPDTGKGLSVVETIGEAGLLFGAGIDTSGTGLTATLFYLSRYPEVKVKLQQELDDMFASQENIKFIKINECKYLHACLDETLRMSIPMTLYREVLPGGITIDGQHIPQGINVACSLWALQHKEAYFVDPYVYTPERWLATEGKYALSPEQRKAFCAFSVGPRVCIGKKVGYMDMSIILSHFLYLYDVEAVPGQNLGAGNPSLPPETGRHREKEYQIKNWFGPGREGPILKIRRRK